MEAIYRLPTDTAVCMFTCAGSCVSKCWPLVRSKAATASVLPLGHDSAVGTLIAATGAKGYVAKQPLLLRR